MSANTNAVSSPRAGHKWWILIAVGLCLFLGSIDGSIVNIALPTLMREFQTDFPTVQWITLAYLIGLAVLVVGMGRLADMVGKKRIFSLGIGLFLAGSALCGLAPTVYWLIGCRFLQSIGAAMMLALGVAILTETWPSHERGQAIGFSAGFISMGIVIGPAIGGAMLQYLSWHWLFYVNIPIGAIALALVLWAVPALPPARSGERFDWVGAFTLGAALLCFTLVMTAGQTLGFASPQVLVLALSSALAFGLFLWVELRVQPPLIDLSLFRSVQFSLNLFTAFLIFVALAGIVLLLPFYLELVTGLPLQGVGLVMAVVPLAMAFVQPASGAFSDRWGTRRVVMVGLICILAGYLLMSTLQVDTPPVGFMLRMLPVAIGMAIFNSPNNSAIMGAAPRHRLGVASGILSMVRTLGQVTGIAVLGAFFGARLNAYSANAAGLRGASPEAIVSALHDQFLLVAAIVGVGAIAAALAWRWERRQGKA